ncbi:MAG: single-stranded DNA-binding protein, partial [Ralstonia sp.]
MFSSNRAEIIGNLGRDPEIRTLNSGAKVASFSVATSESWKDKTTGERKEATQWHNVV